MSGTVLVAPLAFSYFILTHFEVDRCSHYTNFTGEKMRYRGSVAKSHPSSTCWNQDTKSSLLVFRASDRDRGAVYHTSVGQERV